jgi:ribosomal protein S18 acetylase RimI-like enzyme
MVATVRPVAASDVARVSEIMNDPPGEEMLGLVGDPVRAVRFGHGLLELQHQPNPARPTFVADVDGRVGGFLQYTFDAQAMRVGMSEVLLAIRVAGPVRLVRAIPALRARSRVDIPVPRGSLYIAEVHVDPELRGHGIGGLLLDFADAEARRVGTDHLSLHTHIANRARRLYERHGFRVTDVREDAVYERYTGISGRILMEKRLDG